MQRWLKFVKYLRDFQVEPVVYVPQNPHYPILDKELEREVPQGIEILKRRIFEPYQLASLLGKKQTRTISSGIISGEKEQGLIQKILLYIRGNFFIPDARKFWVKPSVKFLEQYLRQEGIQTIITTGPPHSLHLIGLELKRQLSLRWIADFRDPWTRIGYHSQLKLTATSRQRHQALEREVLGQADQILVTSFTTKAEFEQKTDRPVHLITNGYDLIDPETTELDRGLSFSHIGSLLTGRNPKVLWEVFREMLEQEEGFAAVFQLRLIGQVSQAVISSIEAHGLSQYLEVLPYVSHREAQRLQRQSQVLLLLEIDREETRGIIPGKLFEYLYSTRPILAIGPDRWDVGKILEETGGGHCFRYSEKALLKGYVRELYAQYCNGGIPGNPRPIESYSRKALTRKLATLLG